jgi:hypothetical protein
MDATWIITTFVLIDTAMANLDHHTDVRASVPDSEVVTVALVAAKYFANNHRIALTVMRQLHYLLGSISHSRLNRRLHTLLEWMDNLPELLSDMCSTSTIYIVDSMPIPVCRPARSAVQKSVVRSMTGHAMPKTNAILAGNSISFVIVRASQRALSSAHPVHTTLLLSMIWPARSPSDQCSSATVAT